MIVNRLQGRKSIDSSEMMPLLTYIFFKCLARTSLMLFAAAIDDASKNITLFAGNCLCLDTASRRLILTDPLSKMPSFVVGMAFVQSRFSDALWSRLLWHPQIILQSLMFEASFHVPVEFYNDWHLQIRTEALKSSWGLSLFKFHPMSLAFHNAEAFIKWATSCNGIWSNL